MLNVLDESAKNLSPDVKFTQAALAKFNSFLQAEEPGAVIRIGVKGGGCSGYQYNLLVVPASSVDEEEDIQWTSDNVPFVMDIFSESYLKGCEIDHLETLSESGFKFTNPNASRSCGCGSSFST